MGAWSSGVYCRSPHHAPSCGGAPSCSPSQASHSAVVRGRSANSSSRGDQRVGVRRRQPGRGEAAAQPGGAHHRVHGLPEGRVVVGVHGVESEPHHGRLDHAVVRERGVESGRVEGGEPVPQRDVRRGRLLGLERDHTTYALGGVQRLAPQQQLPGQRGAVEPSRGDPRARHRCVPPVVVRDPSPARRAAVGAANDETVRRRSRRRDGAVRGRLRAGDRRDGGHVTALLS